MYSLIVDETFNEGIISFMAVKMIYNSALGLDSNTRSNIPLCLQESPRALPLGTPSGKGVYLTVYPELSPNTDTVLAS